MAVQPGAAVEWTYDVTNTGNTALQNVVVTDDREGQICVLGLLEAGATQQCVASGVAQSVDYQNTATVVAEPIVNPSITVTDDDPSSYVVVSPTSTPTPTVPPAVPPATTPTPSATPPVGVTPTPTPPGSTFGPAIDIELATNGIDADDPPGVSIDIGAPIVWTYVVTNTGVVDLYDIVVSDDLVGGVCRAVTIPVGRR